MVDISFQQFRMLRRAKSTPILTGSLSLNEEAICDYLCEMGFLKASFDIDVDKEQLDFTQYSITQAGEAQLYAFVSAFHKWWISVVIALISLVVSIIALSR